MLRASATELLLTAGDIESALAGYVTGRVDRFSVRTRAGSVLLEVGLSGAPLPVPVTVELTFRTLGVSGTRLELGVEWSNLPLLPGLVKERVLQRAFEALPGTYADGVWQLDAAELMEEAPVQFTIAFVKPEEAGVRVGLSDMILFPVQVATLLDPQPSALVPAPANQDAEIPEHQSYYQRLRSRLQKTAHERAPRWFQPLVPWVLAAPDFFVLLVRLARDERVPGPTKALVGVAIAYFISPLDLIPDLAPLIGHVDDLGLALYVVEQVSRKVPSEVVQELWPGDGRVMDLVRAGIQQFTKALPARIMVALREIVRRG